MLMSVLWFGAIFLYGFGASLMGQAGTVYGWAITVGGSIIVSNAWGAATGEWTGSGAKPGSLMIAGTGLLIFSITLMALTRG